MIPPSECPMCKRGTLAQTSLNNFQCLSPGCRFKTSMYAEPVSTNWHIVFGLILIIGAGWYMHHNDVTLFEMSNPELPRTEVQGY